MLVAPPTRRGNLCLHEVTEAIPLPPSHPPTNNPTLPVVRIIGFSMTSSNFQSIFNAALKEYEAKTEINLFAHPLAAQLSICDSPTAILAILRDQVQEFNQHRSGDERLTKWLNPTVNVLYAYSVTLGEGVGLVSLKWSSLNDLHSDLFCRYSHPRKRFLPVLAFSCWWVSSFCASHCDT